MAMRNEDWWSKRKLVGCAVFASLAVGVSGCALGTDSKQKSARAVKVEKLESRIQELEKTNGRLSVRLDEMEDEVFLLQDRVEAHRLALKRRGFMNGGSAGEARAKAPEPTPQTNYGQQRAHGRYPVRGKSGHSPDDRRQPPPDDGATRIPLSNQQSGQGRQRRTARRERGADQQGAAAGSERSESTEGPTGRDRTRERRRPSSGGESEEKVVITEEDFQKFADEVDGGGGGGAAENGGSGTPTSGKEAKQPVTDEKLPTGDDDGPSAKANARESAPSDDEPDAPAPNLEDDPFSGKSGLDLYKAALGKYRSGEYATALEGFDQFVSNGPRKDYRDNGLYWVGECHYGLGDFEKAVEYFQQVIEEEPGGNKVPDAMLKMALAYREMGMTDRAQRTLEKLTERYPSTNAGRLGKKKLSELNS